MNPVGIVWYRQNVFKIKFIVSSIESITFYIANQKKSCIVYAVYTLLSYIKTILPFIGNWWWAFFFFFLAIKICHLFLLYPPEVLFYTIKWKDKIINNMVAVLPISLYKKKKKLIEGNSFFGIIFHGSH